MVYGSLLSRLMFFSVVLANILLGFRGSNRLLLNIVDNVSDFLQLFQQLLILLTFEGLFGNNDWGLVCFGFSEVILFFTRRVADSSLALELGLHLFLHARCLVRFFFSFWYFLWLVKLLFDSHSTHVHLMLNLLNIENLFNLRGRLLLKGSVLLH